MHTKRWKYRRKVGSYVYRQNQRKKSSWLWRGIREDSIRSCTSHACAGVSEGGTRGFRSVLYNSYEHGWVWLSLGRRVQPNTHTHKQRHSKRKPALNFPLEKHRSTAQVIANVTPFDTVMLWCTSVKKVLKFTKLTNSLKHEELAFGVSFFVVLFFRPQRTRGAFQCSK